MPSRNAITVTGNLAGEPERRFTPSGKSVTSLTVVENTGHRDSNGAWVEDDPVFWQCETWDESLQDNIVASLTKGARVTVVGRYVNQTWEHEGQKRSRLLVRLDEVAASLRFATATIARTPARSGPPPLDDPPF